MLIVCKNHARKHTVVHFLLDTRSFWYGTGISLLWFMVHAAPGVHAKKTPSHSIAMREADDFRGRSRRNAITPLAVFLRSSAASDDRRCSFAREACLDAALPDAEDDEDKRPPIPDGGSAGRDSAAAMMALASESAATGGSYSSMSSSWNDGPAERLGLLAYGIERGSHARAPPQREHLRWGEPLRSRCSGVAVRLSLVCREGCWPPPPPR